MCDFAHSATSNFLPLLHILARFCEKQKAESLFKHENTKSLNFYKVHLTLAARMMLFGDWRAARSVRIFWRSPLHGRSKTIRTSISQYYMRNSKGEFPVHSGSGVCVVDLVQVMLEASVAGTDAPAALQ